MMIFAYIAWGVVALCMLADLVANWDWWTGK